MPRAIHHTMGIVFAAGLVAGTIDIGAASLINRLNPVVILQAVASGLLGRGHSVAGRRRRQSVCWYSGVFRS